MTELQFFIWAYLMDHWWMIWLLVMIVIMVIYMALSHLKTQHKIWQQQKQSLWGILENLSHQSETWTSAGASYFLSNSSLAQVYALSGLMLPFRHFLGGLGAGFLLFLFWGIATDNYFWAFILILLSGLASLTFVYLKAAEQRQKLVSQVPMFLQSLSNALQAGYTLEQSLSFIAEEMSEPLRSEILKIHQKLQLQIPIEVALEEFAELIKNPEVDFFVESTLIQLKTGGNLVILFQKIAHLIEEKLKLNRDIKSFTSQGKLSGILIAVLWPASLFAFSWLSPQHTEVLFNTVPGQTMLAVSILLELIGFWFIWKIITIKI